MPLQRLPHSKLPAEVRTLHKQVAPQADEPLPRPSDLDATTEVVLDVSEDIEWAERSDSSQMQYR